MTGGPSLAVVLTVHDRARTLPVLLERLLAGGGMDSLVVVDDASSDATADVVRAAAARDARVHPVLLGTNVGQPRARWRGVREAGAGLVLSLDDDVVPAAGTVAGHARVLAQEPPGTVVVGSMPVPADRRRRSVAAEEYGRYYDDTCRLWSREPGRILSDLWAGNFSFARQDYLDAVDPDDLTVGYGEDRDLGLRLQRHGLRGAFHPGLAAEHRYERSFEASLRDAGAAARGRAELRRLHPTDEGLLAWLDGAVPLSQRKQRLVRVLSRRRVWPVARAALVAAVGAAEAAGAAGLALPPARFGWLMEQQLVATD